MSSFNNRQALATATLMRLFALLVVIALGGVLGTLPTAAQTSAPSKTSFTYQGQLLNAGSRINATCSFQFTLYDAATAGNSIGATQTVANVAVQDSYFAAQLDFGVTPFGDTVRYLALAVQCPPETTFTAMEGRIALTAAPVALVAQIAPWSGLTGIPTNLTSFSSLACTNGQIAKWNGTAWACAADADTTYAAGTGLALTGTTFSLASVENVPIGATTPSTGKFTTLEAASLKVTGGSPAVGSVLTSNASGTATWQTIPKLSKIIYVAESGGDFTTITAALNSITDASATKPYLVRVAPGIYTEQVTMKPYVSIEGAGEGVTFIKWTGSNTAAWSNNTSATVVGANKAKLSSLTVQSDGTGKSWAVAILNNNSSGGTSTSVSPTLSKLTISVTGNATDSSLGVVNYNSAPSMDDLTINVVGTGPTSGGIYNYGTNATPTMRRLTISVSGATNISYGVLNDNNSAPKIYSSQISGATNSVSNTSSTAKIANTMLDGPVTATSTCIGSYNSSFVALSSTCQ